MSKHLFCFVPIIALMINLYADASKNLLRNPGFEEGLKYWGQNEWSGKESKASFTASRKDARSGENSARIEWISGGDNLLLSQRVTIDGPKSLLLTFWAKSAIQESTNDQVQATAEFFGKDGKRITPSLNKIFTTSDIYQQFSWSFSAPPGTAAINIHLRCRRTVTCFDDVKLIESYGVYLKESIVWPEPKELVIDIFNDLKGDETATLAIELYDGAGNLFSSGKRPVKAHSADTFSFPVKDIKPGTYKLKVYPVGKPESAVVNTIVWPENAPAWPAPYDKLKVRNNFVTELAVRKNIDLGPEKPLKFMNPRRGWVFFSFKADVPCTLQLPGAAGVKLEFVPGQTAESMQFLTAGEHSIAADRSAGFAEITVTTMPEVIASEYESDEARRKFTEGLMDSPAMAEFLRNSNIIMERFVNSNTLEPDKIPESHRERITRWRASGRKTIATAHRTGIGPRWKVTPPDTTKFWTSRVGLNELDGLAIDEFGGESEYDVPFFIEAVNTINRRYPGKTLYAYCNAAWYAHTRTNGFRKVLAAGGHAFTPELYMREQRDKSTAKRYINDFFNYLRLWEHNNPGACRNIVWTYGSSDAYYASYVLDTFPNADHRYFLDLQFCLAANDPAFFGLRGVCPWIIRYAKPDTLAWQAKLIRHYCIEGNRTMLSDKYGYKYDAGHLANPDFADGLAGWTVEPAAPGSITIENIKNYGFDRGTRNTAPDGDDVLLMTRVPGRVNRISQTLQNLKPGSYYEISLKSADYDDVKNGQSPLKMMPVRISVQNAEIDQERSYIQVYPVVQKMKPREQGICGNHQTIVFRAKAPTAKLIITDEVPQFKGRQFHQRPFAAANPNQQRVIFNFIQVQELLPFAESTGR